MNKLVACLLTLSLPGLGQLYARKYTKALLIALGGLSILLIAKYCLLWQFIGFAASLALLLCLMVYSIVDILRTDKARFAAGKKWQQVAALLLAIILMLVGIVTGQLEFGRYRTYGISSSHMKNTLLKGDLVVAAHGRHDLESIKRGDLVEYWLNDEYHVARLIGLPEETIRIERDKVYIDGKLLEEDYAYFDQSLSGAMAALEAQEGNGVVVSNMKDRLLGKGEIFVLGDNRYASRDSRVYPRIMKADLVGKILYIYYSRDITRMAKTAK